MSDAILTTDAEYRITSWNQAAERFYLWDAHEVIGRPLHDVLPECGSCSEDLTAEIDRIGFHRAEVTRRRKDGAELRVESSISFLRDPSGQVFGHLIIDRDVTERHRNDLELRSTVRSTEEATRAKSEFLAQVSHEIRTPMNGILAMLDLLLERGLDPQSREYVRVARNSAHGLLAVVNDVLDLSRIEAGKLELEELPFDAWSLVEQVAEQFGVLAHGKGLELIVRIHPDAPRWLVGDPTRVSQILVNLVGNALKFTTRGLITLRLDGRDLPHGQAQIRLAVEDTGVGFPESVHAQIFESFTQADSSIPRLHGGSGLGLSICRQLAERMGGSIDAMSRIDEGSTFWFNLRLERAVPSSDGRNPIARGARVVLLVRSAPLGQALREQLQAWDLQTELASSYEELLSRLESGWADGEPIDLAILDESAQSGSLRPREVPPATPTLWIQAETNATGTLHAVRPIDRPFLARPVTPSALRSRIEELLPARSGQRKQMMLRDASKPLA